MIDKQQIVFVGPSIVILLDEQIELLDEQQWADLLKVSSLRGRTWSSIEPEDGRIVAKLRLLPHILLPVKSKGECGVALPDGQVPTCYNPTIIVGLGEVQLVTRGGDNRPIELLEQRLSLPTPPLLGHFGSDDTERAGEEHCEYEIEQQRWLDCSHFVYIDL